MIERISPARGALAALAVAAALPAIAMAQRTVQPPRIMVTAFHAAQGEKTLGCQAATAVREKLADDNPQRILFVIPREDLKNALEQSGYQECDPLASNDAKALANFARADEYVEGTVTKTAAGFKLDSRLFLARDNTYSQPMPSVDGARLNDIAGKFSRALDDVRRQIEDEKECYLNTRQDKAREGMQKARDAIKRYNRAVLARVCLLQAMDKAKMPKDSLLAVAQEILAIDSSSRPALQITSSWYREKGDTTRWVDALVKLVAADPTNVRLVNDVINQLGQLKRFPVAIPIIKHALSEQQGDAQLLALAFKVYYGAESWKDFISVGDEIARIDTAMMDSSYFYRMAQAFTADSQPAKTGEMFAKASQKFPTSTTWLLLLAQTQRQAGQNQQAMETYKKALAVDPKTKGIYLQLARSYAELNQPDSSMAMIRAGAGVRDTVTNLAVFALGQGNNWYKKGQASKSRDDYLMAIRWTALSDTLVADARASMLIAASATNIAVSALQEAGPAKSCDLAKMSSDYFTMVSLIVPKAFQVNKEQAGQLMGYATQYGPSAEKLKTQLCK
ncbi:MAG: tetratricopeptide repeat protein [Gemmatimonadetes bacterium]|nr:tetratricopeptide repeat protein [Gemmatimonadota bacterium]